MKRRLHIVRSRLVADDKGLADPVYAKITSLKARAIIYLRRNGKASIGSLTQLGLTREYVSQLCTRHVIQRESGGDYVLR